jgi:serine/threonine protein kinase/tetratricopeptide (TPR) repeat protein
MREHGPASSSLARVKEVFLAVVDLEGALRDAELTHRCGDDPLLRSKVVRMLEGHAVERGFLESPVAMLVQPLNEESAPEPTPARIGPFAVSGLLGQGGFGSVYRARQETPIRREVAIKVIRRGMDSRGVVARFEAERQTLAVLSHPNVARVIDAGETDDGRPYFVMELIDGVPITRHCDEERLSIQRRLRLFIDVCRAVEHAHQKGVIHRDIKPSNVMVQRTDGRADVKVIDFGIAKAIDPLGSTGERGAGITVESQLLGTPDYMSPEQVDPELGGVDTRVDIYALGTLLYELLSGVTPLGIAARSGSSLPETLRLIRETDPPRPSQRVASLGAERVAVASARATDPKRHHAALVRDLDWIVLRAIEKERGRRYDSVGSLVADIERHLANEPVLAARPSAGYVARKFIQRHRVGVAATALLVFGLAVGLVVTLFALHRAVEAEATATRARGELAAVNDFLVDDLLSEARASRGGPKMTIVEALKNATATIDQRFATQPVTAARVRLVVASVYRSLGLFDAALKAIEPAAAVLRETVGPDDVLTLDAESVLAGALRDLGRLDEAERLLRAGEERARLAHGPDSWLRLVLLAHLGEVLQKAEKHAQAEPILRDAFERFRRVYPDDDEYGLTSAISLVASLGAQKRYAEAIPYSEAILERAKARFPASNPLRLAAMNNHASMLTNLDRLTEAEATYRELLAAVTEAMPAGHWQIAVTRLALGISIDRQEGRRGEATELLHAAASEMLAALGPDHAYTERAFNVWADNLRMLKSPEELEALLPAVGLRLRVAAPNARDSAVKAVRAYLGRSAATRDDHTDGKAFDELEGYCQAIVDRGEPQGARALSNLGWACLDCGDSVRAERLLLRADQSARAAAQPDAELLREIADRLASLYDAAGKSEEAKLWRAKGSGGR